MEALSGDPLLEVANRIAFEAHKDQFRRDGSTPYYKHCHAVAQKLSQRGVDAMAVAYLHDVLEDTSMTVCQLEEAGIPDKLVQIIAILTKRDGETYMNYLGRIKQDPLATLVKIADMLHNLSDMPTDRQIIKYSKGLLFLLDG